ncbi:MAG: PQQ-binding-like beta-propeller repeat protein [Hyphomicrobiaceae bacterium]|nr:PQQ-binding-like beta-propeller repeat protein [Hyphomicrobiaceae bacterium]
MGSVIRWSRWSALLAAALLTSACSSGLPSLPKISELNPFKEKVTPLPGQRIAIMQTADKIPGELAAADKPILLPPEQDNEAWSQPGGVAGNAPGHLSLAAAVRQTWSADAGNGSSNSGRVTASPIVVDNRVFTLDATGTVTAFSAGGGSAVWRASIVPEKEKGGGGFFSLGGGKPGGGYGGGIAADSGRIYAVSGFGNVVALDPGSGKKLWERSLGVPVRAAPAAASDRVFVISIDGKFYCLSGIDGAELWNVRGLPQQASLVMNVSPAVSGDTVVVPYPSGDLVALKVSDGTAVWSESLSRTRSVSQLNSLSDAARPAIDGGTVFAAGHAGRMVATQLATGERLWSINVPSTQTPWVAGGSVFVVDTSGQLIAIDRTTGNIQWTAQLPGSNTWSGPVLASGRLWLASAKGILVNVDAVTGKVLGQQDLGDPVYIPPVVAQRRMYVLTDKARLIALN